MDTATVGKEGLLILYNTLARMCATENLADYVVGMEFGPARALSAMPPPAGSGQSATSTITASRTGVTPP